MGELLRHWLLPEQMRFLPKARAWSIGFRTIHLTAFGLLLGGYAFAVDPDKLLPYLWVTILSGLGLIAIEMGTMGLYWLFLGKGIMVLVKLVLMLAIPVFWEARIILLLLVVVIASVGSHMPSRYRHYSVLHQRVIMAGEPLRPAIRGLELQGVVVGALEDAHPQDLRKERTLAP
jgi:hypothetical protein